MSEAPVLFGTDGIRGIAGRYPLDKEFVRRIGAASAAVFLEKVKRRPPVFLMGRDTRTSGKWITEAFAAGAASQGVRVRNVAVTSTPSLAYLVPQQKALGGVMISASHNPAEFNGIKLFNPFGRKAPDEWERLIEADVHEMPPVPRVRGRIRSEPELVKIYLRYLKETLVPHTTFKGLTLVVDCSHGSLSKIAPAFLRGLGARVYAIGAAPDGRNINQDCGSQHTEKLRAEVLKRKADAGLAFDGDADRIILCDEQGHELDGDYILACASHCLAKEKKLKGNAVVVTVMANLGFLKALSAWKIKTHTTPVGDRYVSEVLEERGYVIGGEQSGHIIFHNYLPTGDGLLTGIQLLSMLRRQGRPLSWVYSLFQKYPQVLLNVRVKDKKPLETCPLIQHEIERARKKLADHGRVVVRYSGTEPLLRIMMEGPEQRLLQDFAERIARAARQTLGAA